MKKILLFLLFSSFYFGQYKALDSIQLTQKIEQLVKDSGKNFVLSKKDKDYNKIAYMYKNPDNENDNLMIIFYPFMQGEDEALEIKGTKKWDIQSVSGNFLSLFPIWQKYSNTKSEKEVISKKGFEYYTTPEGKSSDFVGRGSFWMIRF